MKTENDLLRPHAKRISDEIKYDIKHGIYDRFGLLIPELKHIADKLYKMQYIVNHEGLTEDELYTLELNDYWYPSDYINND